jgi:hypothetical protein
LVKTDRDDTALSIFVLFDQSVTGERRSCGAFGAARGRTQALADDFAAEKGSAGASISQFNFVDPLCG